MANARDLRLQADYEQVVALAQGSGGTLALESVRGKPPDEYVLAYRCRTIERLEQGKPVYRHLTRVRIRLPAKYPAPSAPPVVHVLTPIYHPHVYPDRAVCMGSWQTTEYLEDFVRRLGALVQFDRAYLNVRDPANEEAVQWAYKHLHLLPTDTCTFHNDPPERVWRGEETPTGGFVPNPEFALQPPERDPRPATEESEALAWKDI